MRNRNRFNGSIPLSILEPLRACVLQHIDRESCINIMKLFNITEELTMCYIQELETFTRVDLLDNGFWWQDSFYRANGERFLRKRAQDNVKNVLFTKRIKVPNIIQCNSQNKTLNGLTLCYWLPDYAHWAPVVRIIKNDKLLFLQVWLGQIHWRLFLPANAFHVSDSFRHRVPFNGKQALFLLKSLCQCLMPFWDVEQGKYEWEYNTTKAAQMSYQRHLEYATQCVMRRLFGDDVFNNEYLKVTSNLQNSTLIDAHFHSLVRSLITAAIPFVQLLD